jgi:Ca2+-binding EF-hand superfamily protein
MSRSFLPDFWRRSYRLLLHTYPPDFRRRYGREMEQAFADRCRALVQNPSLRGYLDFGARIASDWVVTTVREGIASMRVPAQVPATAGPALHDAPFFYTCGNETPKAGALFHGALLSLASFAMVTFLLGHAGDRRLFLIGSHHPSDSHLLHARTSAIPSQSLDSEIKVKPRPDEPPVPPDVQLFLVFNALDIDHDNVISAAEIAAAPSSLRKLDKNHDGKLSAQECGYHFAGDVRLAFMRMDPILAALDADHDGEISSSEINRAADALLTLDKNGDGRLTEEELRPVPPGR